MNSRDTRPQATPDPTTQAFFEAARRGRLLLQRCVSCAEFQLYPRVHCVHCGGRELDYVESLGRGVIYSLTRVYLEVLPHKPPPYFVGIVALDEGPRITASLQEGPRHIGETVYLYWQNDAAGHPSPLFSPVPTRRTAALDASVREAQTGVSNAAV